MIGFNGPGIELRCRTRQNANVVLRDEKVATLIKEGLFCLVGTLVKMEKHYIESADQTFAEES